MSTPDHAENTGDNLRHAVDVQQDARDHQTDAAVADDQSAVDVPLPDFNS